MHETTTARCLLLLAILLGALAGCESKTAEESEQEPADEQVSASENASGESDESTADKVAQARPEICRLDELDIVHVEMRTVAPGERDDALDELLAPCGELDDATRSALAERILFRSDPIELPLSTAAPRPSEMLTVTVTEDAIIVESDEVVALDAARLPPGGAGLEPIAAVRHRLTAAASERDTRGQLTIIAHVAVPYATITRIVQSGLAAELTRFRFAVLGARDDGEPDPAAAREAARAPTTPCAERIAHDGPEHHLRADLRPDGICLYRDGALVEPIARCVDTGVTICPRGDVEASLATADHDIAAFYGALLAIEQRDDWRDHRALELAATATVPFGLVVAAMDAARHQRRASDSNATRGEPMADAAALEASVPVEEDGEPLPLFPDVLLSPHTTP